MFPTFDDNKLANFGRLTKNNLDLGPMNVKFNRVLEVVEVYVRAKFHQTKCSGS